MRREAAHEGGREWQACVRYVLVAAAVFAALTAGRAFALKPAGAEAPLEMAATLALPEVGTVNSPKRLLKQRQGIRLLGNAARGVLPPPGRREAGRWKVGAMERESLAAAGGFRNDGRISTPDAILESPIDLCDRALDVAYLAPGEIAKVLGRHDRSLVGFSVVETDVLAGLALRSGGVAGTVERTRAGIRFLGGLAVVLIGEHVLVGGMDRRALRGAARGGSRGRRDSGARQALLGGREGRRRPREAAPRPGARHRT